MAWIRSLIEQCRAAEVPVFVKQLGARPISATGWPSRFCWDVGGGFETRLQDRKGGDPSEWPEDLRVREFPELQEATT